MRPQAFCGDYVAWEMIRSWPILWKPNVGWARPIKQTSWMRPAWPFCCATGHCRRFGFPRTSCAINVSADSDLSGPAAYSGKESDSCDAGPPQHSVWNDRSFQCGWPRPVGVSSSGVAGIQQGTVRQELGVLDSLEMRIELAERRLESIMAVGVEADLKTLPYIGKILSMVLMLEIWQDREIPQRRSSGRLRRVSTSGVCQRQSYAHGSSVQ